MNHAIRTGQNLYKGAELSGADNPTCIDFANFSFLCQRLHHLDGTVASLAIGRSNEDCAIFPYVNPDARFVLDGAHCLATRADDLADLLWVNLDGDDARRVGRQAWAGLPDRLQHPIQDMKPGFTSLG